MQLEGARTLVLGGTGVLGSSLAQALREAGAVVAVAGRDPQKLAQSPAPTFAFDALDVDGLAATIASAAEALGGLDLLVVAFGVAAFGPAAEAADAVTEELFAVNTLAPMAAVRAAVPHLGAGSSVVVLSAILADLPTLDMAEYSASKAALAAWLSVARRELRRRKINVIDVRPPHIDTGLAERALAGTPPKLPTGFPADRLVAMILQAVRDDAASMTYDAKAADLVIG